MNPTTTPQGESAPQKIDLPEGHYFERVGNVYALFTPGGHEVPWPWKPWHAKKFAEAMTRAPSGSGAIPEDEGLWALLEKARDEMEAMRDGETCDHSVGICWCQYHGLIEQIDEALARQAAQGMPALRQMDDETKPNSALGLSVTQPCVVIYDEKNRRIGWTTGADIMAALSRVHPASQLGA